MTAQPPPSVWKRIWPYVAPLLLSLALTIGYLVLARSAHAGQGSGAHGAGAQGSDAHGAAAERSVDARRRMGEA